MEVEYTENAKRNIDYWKKSNKPKILDKITSLISSIQETPYHGVGKPEPLKYNLSGLWSRRINKEHRLVYEVLDDFIRVHSIKGHY